MSWRLSFHAGALPHELLLLLLVWLGIKRSFGSFIFFAHVVMHILNVVCSCMYYICNVRAYLDGVIFMHIVDAALLMHILDGVISMHTLDGVIFIYIYIYLMLYYSWLY